MWTKKGRPKPKPSIFAGLRINNDTPVAPATTAQKKKAPATPKPAAKPANKKTPSFSPPKLKSGQPTNKTGRKVVEKKLEMAGKTKILGLTEHGLEDIPAQVYQIKGLKTLDVSHNKIKRLGNQLADLQELKSLNVEENRLTALGPVSSLTKLQTLSAGGNKLGQSASALPPLPPSLKHLKLDHNAFTSIPRSIVTAPLIKLEKLDLSHNQLTSVPSEICNLTGLTELNLDHNALTKLPASTGQLTKLKTLSLKHNKLRGSLPAAVFENTLLIDLNLHGNPMTATQLNEMGGYQQFLDRRQKVKSKDIYGGALTDLDVCGLK